MQIRYAQAAFVDGSFGEHPITPSVIRRFEKDMKMPLSQTEGVTDSTRILWMAFQEAGATDLAFDAWLDSTVATDVREEDLPFGGESSGAPTTGTSLPSPSSPVTD